jgi:DNA replication protein DnaC
MPSRKKPAAPMSDPLDEMPTRLQLTGTRDRRDTLLDEAARANPTASETLALPCEREIASKDRRRIDMAPKLAHFPVMKNAASFDFSAQPSVDQGQMRDPAAGRWIANGENLLPLGPPEPAS